MAPLDPAAQALVDAIRKRGWDFDITREGPLYFAVASRPSGVVNVATGQDLQATVLELARKVGADVEDGG